MGPGACSDRAPVQQHGRTYPDLDALQSFQRHASDADLLGPEDLMGLVLRRALRGRREGSEQGDVHRPVMQGAMSTLGGNCEKQSCGDIWSAAVPEGDAAANQRFYTYMHEHHPNLPANKPARRAWRAESTREIWRPGGQYQTAGVIQNDTADGVKEHCFIRAETHLTKDDAAAFAFTMFGGRVFGSSVPAPGWPSA